MSDADKPAVNPRNPVNSSSPSQTSPESGDNQGQHIEKLIGLIKNNSLNKAIIYARENRLIFIEADNLTAIQQKGVLSFVLADLFLKQGESVKASKFYSLYLSSAVDIWTDNSGRNLYYEAHIESAIINYKAGNYQNALSHLENILNSEDIELKLEDELYCKLLMTGCLSKVRRSDEATDYFKNIMPIKDVEIEIKKNDPKNFVGWKPQFVNAGTLCLKKPLEEYRDILADIIQEKENRSQFAWNFIDKLVDSNFQGLSRSKILGDEQIAIMRLPFILVRTFSAMTIYGNRLIHGACLSAAMCCPAPRNLEEAVCKAEGFIVNEMYSDAVKIINPLIKTQSDAIFVLLKSGMQEEKDVQKEGCGPGYIFFYHVINLAKELLKSRDFKYPEIADYAIGYLIKSSIGHSDYSAEEKDEFMMEASRRMKKALKSNRLPADRVSEAKNSISFVNLFMGDSAGSRKGTDNSEITIEIEEVKKID